MVLRGMCFIPRALDYNIRDGRKGRRHVNRTEPNQAEPGGSHVVALLPCAGERRGAMQALERLLPQVRRLVVVDEPARVMLELHRGADSVVLLHGRPETQSELLAAIAKYHAAMPVFLAEIDIASRRLTWRPVHDNGAAAAPAPAASPAPHGAHRTAAPVATAHPGARRPTAAANEAFALLTEEELAMLMTPLGEAPSAI
jgi:hypothetical protein